MTKNLRKSNFHVNFKWYKNLQDLFAFGPEVVE